MSCDKNVRAWAQAIAESLAPRQMDPAWSLSGDAAHKPTPDARQTAAAEIATL